MHFLLYGADTFRSRQYLRKLREKFFIDRDPQRINCISISAKEAEPGKILEEMCVTSFLAEKRMVIVENAFAAKDKTLWDALEAFFAGDRIGDKTIVLFWEGTDTLAAHPLADRLLKEKYTQKFDNLSGTELVGWIGERAHERGATIARDAANVLAENTENMFALSHALNQCVAAARGGVITRGIALQYAPPTPEATIFEVVDALISRNEGRAYEKFHALWDVDSDPAFFISVIGKQLRVLLSVHEYRRQNPEAKQDAIAKELGEHPFVIKKSLAALPRLTPQTLISWYERLLDIDRGVKSGSDPVVLFDHFISQLSGAAE